ncbi:putative ankyrin repeat protein [Pseudocercospora fuligena]|uniref:Putative ankyrin repeat protein n=1 Tax=Pseudocercospora fuligena TaxID=685502 RepID=A0A8H6RK67_9PEZI|nr:putative ankyrin repeat protein [Pseudocercospora fuligena]
MDVDRPRCPHDRKSSPSKLAGGEPTTPSYDESRAKRQKLLEEQHVEQGRSVPRAAVFGESSVSGQARAQFGHQYFHGNVEQHFHDAAPPVGSPTTSLETILESLSFEQMGSRLLTIGRAQARTCRWLLSKPEYEGWRDRNLLAEHNGFLWIKGKPAAGKSTAMKFLYDDARRRAQAELVISFFFNARGDALEMSVEGMYRSLLHQLLRKVPGLHVRLQDSSLVTRTQIWSVDVLKAVFFDAVLGLNGAPLVCYIDALDECHEDDVREMVEFLQTLAEASMDEGQQFFVCFSSRHYPHITVRRGQTIVLESQQEHDKDISEYIQANLHIEETNLALKIKSEIQTRASGVFLWVVLVLKILNKAYDSGRLDLLYARLKDIPDGLNRLFEDILARGPSDHAELILTIQWILFAQRPLRPNELYHAVSGASHMNGTLSEICTDGAAKRFVVDSSKGLAEITPGKEGVAQFIHESVRDYLLYGGGLTALDSTLSANITGHCHNHLKTCCHQYLLATRTAVSASVDSLTSSPEKFSKKKRKKLLKLLPFLEYSVKGVLYHSEAAARSGLVQEVFIRDYPVSVLAKAHNMSERYPVRHYSNCVDMAYLLVEKNALYLLKEWRPQNVPLTDSERYGSAFGLALKKHNMPAVILLLQHGISSDSEGFDDLEEVLNIAKIEPTHAFSLFLNNRPRVKFGTLGDDLLRHAVLKSPELVPMLVSRGARIRRISEDDARQFMSCFLRPDSREPVALDELIDAFSADTLGTLLLTAVETQNAVVVDRLLAKGADCNGDISQGPQPLLHISIVNDDSRVFRRLIQGGADVNFVGGSYTCPLGASVATENQDIFEVLLARGAYVDLPMTVREQQSPLSRAVESGHEEMVIMLLERGALVDIPQADFKRGSPLLSAIRNGRTNIVALLIDHGARIDIPGVTGAHQEKYRYVAHTENFSLLETAVQVGNEEIVAMLLERGADSREKAIQLAIELGEMSLAEMIRSHNTGASALNRILLEIALRRADSHVLRQLRSRTVDKDTASSGLIDACASRSLDVIKAFLEHGADVNAARGEHRTALLVACHKQRADLVKFLIDNGVDVNGPAHKGIALRAAINSDDPESVQLLLRAGANVNGDPGDYDTPLEIACYRRRHDLVELLIKHGANVNAQTSRGGALSTAVRWRDARSVSLLLQAGADVNAGNGIVMRKALEAGDDRIIRLLKEHGAQVV